MSLANLYKSFLDDAYHKILKACVEDEAVITLKTIEDSECLLLRVNELFAEVYVEERQRKFAQLTEELEKAQATIESLRVAGECRSCVRLKKELEAQQQQMLIMEISSSNSKRIEALLQRENESIKAELKKRNQDYFTQQTLLKQAAAELEEELQANRKENQSKLNSYSRKIDELKTELRDIAKEKNVLQEKLEVLLDKNLHQDQQRRQLASKNDSLKAAHSRISLQVKGLKEQRQVLEEKISRLENDNQFRVQANDKLEREIKNIKSNLAELEQDRARTEPRLQDEIHLASFVGKDGIAGELHEKLLKGERKQFELQKQVTGLQEELRKKQFQFEESRAELHKKTNDLEELLKKAKFNFAKETRLCRQECVREAAALRQKLEEASKDQLVKVRKHFNEQLQQRQAAIARLNQRVHQQSRKIQEVEERAIEQHQREQEERRSLEKSLREMQVQKNELDKTYRNNMQGQLDHEEEHRRRATFFQHQCQRLKEDDKKKERERIEARKQLECIREQADKLQHKNEELLSILDTQRQQMSSQEKAMVAYKQAVREKEKEINYWESRVKELEKEAEEREQEICKYKQYLHRREETEKDKDKELAALRQKIISLQDEYRVEIVQIYEKAQASIEEAKKQAEHRYLHRVKTTDSKTAAEKSVADFLEKEGQIKDLRSQVQQLDDKLMQTKEKLARKDHNITELQTKLKQYQSKCWGLELAHSKTVDELKEEKTKSLQMLKIHQQKMGQHASTFSQFKFQFYVSLQEAFRGLKSELKTIAEQVIDQQAEFSRLVTAIGKKFEENLMLQHQSHQLQVAKIREEYEQGTIRRLQQEKRELIQANEQQLKEKTLELYTIFAEKECQLNAYEEKEFKLIRTIQAFEQNQRLLDKQIRDFTRKNEQLRQLLAKAEAKMIDSQRDNTKMTHELVGCRAESEELRRKLMAMELNFKEKLEKCKEKFSVENDKLFQRYEKQFGKFIVSNKRSLELSMLSSSKMSQQIPTKGYDDDKLDRIQEQIHEQKKKLQQLQATNDPKLARTLKNKAQKIGKSDNR